MHMLITTMMLSFALLITIAACDGSDGGSVYGGQDGDGQETKPTRPTTGPAARATNPDFPVVKLETTEGTIMLELDKKKAPKTVANFLSYVKKGHYAGTTFHRVIANFMIQGGGMTAEGAQKPTDPPIKNESDNGLSNKRGTIAMARTALADSATSQFFINVVDNSANLDYPAHGGGYAVFGKVVDDESMKVVDKIRYTPVNGSAPKTPIKITKATIVSE